MKKIGLAKKIKIEFSHPPTLGFVTTDSLPQKLLKFIKKYYPLYTNHFLFTVIVKSLLESLQPGRERPSVVLVLLGVVVVLLLLLLASPPVLHPLPLLLLIGRAGRPALG
jgi:hypothetical protein